MHGITPPLWQPPEPDTDLDPPDRPPITSTESSQTNRLPAKLELIPREPETGEDSSKIAVLGIDRLLKKFKGDGVFLTTSGWQAGIDKRNAAFGDAGCDASLCRNGAVGGRW